MEYKSIRKDLFAFLRQPDYERYEDLSLKNKLLILFKIFILTHIGLILVNIPNIVLKKLEIMGELTQKSDLMYEYIKKDLTGYKSYFMLIMILIAPIIEELSFRLPLGNFSIRFLTISISLIVGLYLGDYLSKLLWRPDSYLGFVLIYYSYIFIVVFLVFSILNIGLIKRNIEKIQNGWNAKPGMIFYLIASLFAISHINNLKIEPNDLFFLPLILLPFFVYGLVFGYLRIRLGVFYSMILHILINGLSFGLTELHNALKANIV